MIYKCSQWTAEKPQFRISSSDTVVLWTACQLAVHALMLWTSGPYQKSSAEKAHLYVLSIEWFAAATTGGLEAHHPGRSRRRRPRPAGSRNRPEGLLPEC